MASISIWKIFGLMGRLAEWSSRAMAPEADGKIKITPEELSDLARVLCEVFGWRADIAIPEEWEKPNL